MDSKIIFFLFLITVASGCVHESLNSNIPSSESDEGAPDKGLVVQEFKVSDESLSASQQGRITLLIKNFHEEDVNIQDISLFNTGFLETREKNCNPSPDELESVRENIAPEMECTWIVESPEDLGDFRSKVIPLKLNLEYETSFIPDEPMKVHFDLLDNIERTQNIQKQYSNGEVKLNLRSENPIPYNQNGTLEVRASKAGNGVIDGKEFEFSYTPEEVFNNCPGKQEFVIENGVEFSCGLGLKGDYVSRTTRNLDIATHYKYVKQPSLDIRVVNNR